MFLEVDGVAPRYHKKPPHSLCYFQKMDDDDDLGKYLSESSFCKNGTEPPVLADSLKRKRADMPSTYYANCPATVVRRKNAADKLASDFFLASKNQYKARITKFVRTVQTGGELAETSIAKNKFETMLHDPTKLQTLEKKSRFSFKRDGIVAVSNLVDVFCDAMLFELKNIVRQKHADGQIPEFTSEDVGKAVARLGWGHRVDAAQ